MVQEKHKTHSHRPSIFSLSFGDCFLDFMKEVHQRILEKSKIAKNNQRKKAISVYSERRQELLKIIKDPNTSYDEKREAQKKIAKMPRDASPTRHRNRCEVTGRPRGTLRKFGMSRNTFRDLALKGELPGIKKASW